MAKAKTKPTEHDIKADRELAARAVRHVTGCGVPESQARVGKMPDEQVQAIANAERSKNRDKVPSLLSADK